MDQDLSEACASLFPKCDIGDHMKTLKQVLQALRLSNLKVNPKKCEFIKDEIKFGE